MNEYSCQENLFIIKSILGFIIHILKLLQKILNVLLKNLMWMEHFKIDILTLIVPRAWEIGYTQPCIKCQGKSTTHYVYFWSRKTLHYTYLEATSYIPQQDQRLHFWSTSLSTTGCYKNKYTISFLWMACISRFATAILSSETELALGTIRVNPGVFHVSASLIRHFWIFFWNQFMFLI